MLIIAGKNARFVRVKHMSVWSTSSLHKRGLHFERLAKSVFVGCWEIPFFHDYINANVILEYHVSLRVKKDTGIMIERLLNVLRLSQQSEIVWYSTGVYVIKKGNA